jgi:hypothetical protein
MNLLDVLPYDLCKSILSEWVDHVFDVDRAFCNRSSRSKYLYCLRGCEIHEPVSIKSVQKWDELIRWNASRNAKFVKVNITIDAKYERNIFEEIEEILPCVQNLTVVFNSLHADWVVDLRVLTQVTSIRSLEIVGLPASNQKSFPLTFTYLLPIVTGSTKHSQRSMLHRICFQDVEFGTFHLENHHNNFFDWIIVCCPHLEELLFFHCNGLPNQELFSFVERLARLKRFVYESKWPLSRWITDGQLPQNTPPSQQLTNTMMSLHHPGLQHIGLAAFSVSQLLLQCPNLDSLALHLSFLTSPATFCQHTSTWKHLSTLQFLNANWLNNDIIESICMNCTQITSLTFQHCTHRMTTAAYQTIAKYLRQLHTFHAIELGITAMHQDLVDLNLFRNAFDDAAIDALCDTLPALSSSTSNNLTATMVTDEVHADHSDFIALPLHSIRLDSAFRITRRGYHRLLHESRFSWKSIDICLVGNTKLSILEELLTYLCYDPQSPTNEVAEDSTNAAMTVQHQEEPTWYPTLENLVITFMHTFGRNWTLSKPWKFRHPTIQKIVLVGLQLPEGNLEEIKAHCPKAMIRLFPSANIVFVGSTVHRAERVHVNYPVVIEEEDLPNDEALTPVLPTALPVDAGAVAAPSTSYPPVIDNADTASDSDSEF